MRNNKKLLSTLQTSLWQAITSTAWRIDDPFGVVKGFALHWVLRACSKPLFTRTSIRSLFGKQFRTDRHPKSREEDRSTSVIFIATFPALYYQRPLLRVIEEWLEYGRGERLLWAVPPDCAEGIELPNIVKKISTEIFLPKSWLSSLKYGFKLAREWKSNRPSDIPKAFLRNEVSDIFWGAFSVAWYRELLVSKNCTAIITMNEQHPPSSLIVSAAKSLGIPVFQILHGGAASPLYTPFQADETWVDFSFTRQSMINFGAAPERVKSAPGITAFSPSFARPDNQSRLHLKHNRKRLLFLSQWLGSEGLGSPIFRDGLITAAKLIASASDSWDLLIRSHPWDTDEMTRNARIELQKIGINALWLDKKQILKEQILACDLVGTVSSTGVFEAIGLGCPAFTFWNEDIQTLHGAPFLPESWLVRTDSDLLRILTRIEKLGKQTAVELEEHLNLEVWNVSSNIFYNEVCSKIDQYVEFRAEN